MSACAVQQSEGQGRENTGLRAPRNDWRRERCYTLRASISDTKWACVTSHSATADIAAAVETLRAGGLVAYPTDTLYGLGADALNEAAVERVFEAKGRPQGMPLPLLISGQEQLSMVAEHVPDVALRLAEAFWPGGLTLVLAVSEAVPPLVTARGWKVAVRLPDHPVPRSLAEGLGRPHHRHERQPQRRTWSRAPPPECVRPSATRWTSCWTRGRRRRGGRRRCSTSPRNIRASCGWARSRKRTSSGRTWRARRLGAARRGQRMTQPALITRHEAAVEAALARRRPDPHGPDLPHDGVPTRLGGRPGHGALPRAGA